MTIKPKEEFSYRKNAKQFEMGQTVYQSFNLNRG